MQCGAASIDEKTGICVGHDSGCCVMATRTHSAMQQLVEHPPPSPA